MYTFIFSKFAGQLNIEYPTHNGIPPNSPLFVFYKEEGNLSRHEILRRFHKTLTENDITYLRPINNLTGEWLFDLKEFKHSFECFKDNNYLNTKITVEPERIHEDKYETYYDRKYDETKIKISVYPEDLVYSSVIVENELSIELNEPLARFRKDFENPSKCGFLMMKFEDTNIQSEIVNTLKEHFKSKGFNLLRADDKFYSDDLFSNIKTYMHGCAFGVALFERINSNYFNPNVSLEIGYMMAMCKPILFLKDKTLTSLHTDLIGKLYFEYDFQNPKNTLPNVIDKWVLDKELI